MKLDEKRHPIQVVARRTGLTPDVLRVWEKRYQAVTPARSPSGRRLYSDHDVEHLLFLRRATLFGRSIGQIAHLPPEELRAMVIADEEIATRAPRPAHTERKAAKADIVGERGAISKATTTQPYLATCLAHIRELDAAGLEAALARAAVDLSRPVLMEQVLVPLLHSMGDLWRDGSLRIAHEHLASAVVRTFLGALREGFQSRKSAPGLVATTPAGQLHEFGALLAAATASSEGWRITYLGPNLPAEDIAAAAKQLGARAVALSIVYPADDVHLGDELRKLRLGLGEDVVLLVGGRAAVTYGSVLDRIDAIRLDDMAGLRTELESIRSRGVADIHEG